MQSLVIRKAEFDFKDVPRHWADNDAFITHWFNAYNLIVVDAEYFIIRYTKKFGGKSALVNDFCVQEAEHAKWHRKSHDMFLRQGYPINPFLKAYRFVSFKLLEPMLSDKLCLSIASGIEHINTVCGEMGLSGDTLSTAHSEMQKAFTLHFIEEIEHRSVTFEALERTSKSYLLRALGMIIAAVMTFGDLWMATLYFMINDGSLFKLSTWKRAFSFFFTKEKTALVFTGRMMDYLHPDFHPVNSDKAHLVGEGETLLQKIQEKVYAAKS